MEPSSRVFFNFSVSETLDIVGKYELDNSFRFMVVFFVFIITLNGHFFLDGLQKSLNVSRNYTTYHILRVNTFILRI